MNPRIALSVGILVTTGLTFSIETRRHRHTLFRRALLSFPAEYLKRRLGETALGALAKQITVGVNQDGRLEVFYVGTDDKIYHNCQYPAGARWAGELLLSPNCARSCAITTDLKILCIKILFAAI